MGYGIHITRKPDWSDEEGARISESEWQAYVASDSEMAITGVAEARTPDGDVIRLAHPLLTEGRCHSSGKPVWFSYLEGSLAVKNPDEECLGKMRQIAKKLQARVQGDEGEFYDNPPEGPSLFGKFFRR